MKDFFIRLLGGITKEHHEKFRSGCESWAVENLTGKNGEVTPDCLLYIPYHNDDICVIRSRITICDGVIKDLKIAPWCREVICSGLRNE